MTDIPQVRNDCVFCHRERSAKDDNHAPECAYWNIGPGSLIPDADLPEGLKRELNMRRDEFPLWKGDQS